MNLLESLKRGLEWVATPRYLPGRLEMQTQRGKRLEMEVVSFKFRVPFPGGAMISIPVFIMVMPVGSSPIEGLQVRSEDRKD
ncbi:hypothetical protein AU184_15330 [Mycolicibacterium novocastrense]|uniref:hypothetical protein n=1 Tax=Mycolicibacterium novocastrense TaxID=59813 RepID=UPI000748A8D8|nr:hypothetical protein [Mycolicibacterium novocastrense]KUH75763.1 hypothetical protein AU183_00350 [Mycolicibacterium novocastrense]KUH78324.1 hypothetical protein AU072_10410 [Mycolicibacterium novocastrense]KUH79659.1 hypothetical protein AU184_15330 [Mycolicibacterium novocastrense]